jgi:hypothetical protein
MACIRSTSRYVGGAATSGSSGEGGGFEDRMESARLSDDSSCNEASDAGDEGSRSRSFYFGPSTVTMSRIHGMIDNDYFPNGMDHEPGEEAISEPNADEAVVFEELFIPSLRMPPHPVLSTILLKYQIHIHQLIPNAIVQLLKYVPSAEGFTKRYELHYQPRKIDVYGVKVQGQYGCFNFHVKCGVSGRSSLWLSRTSGPDLGHMLGFTAKFI